MLLPPPPPGSGVTSELELSLPTQHVRLSLPAGFLAGASASFSSPRQDPPAVRPVPSLLGEQPAAAERGKGRAQSARRAHSAGHRASLAVAATSQPSLLPAGLRHV